MTDNSEVYFPQSDTEATKPATPLPSAAPTNTYALGGFILSLVSYTTFVTAIPGIVLGHLGLKQIRETGESGRGMAIAAITIGWVMIGLGILTVLIVSLFFLIPLTLAGLAGALRSH
jgi:hypothetical protein